MQFPRELKNSRKFVSWKMTAFSFRSNGIATLGLPDQCQPMRLTLRSLQNEDGLIADYFMIQEAPVTPVGFGRITTESLFVLLGQPILCYNRPCSTKHWKTRGDTSIALVVREDCGMRLKGSFSRACPITPESLLTTAFVRSLRMASFFESFNVDQNGRGTMFWARQEVVDARISVRAGLRSRE